MNRIIILRISTLLLFLLLVTQLWQLQFREGEKLASAAVQNSLRTLYQRPLRGEIYASDGKTVLAASNSSYTIAVQPNQLPKADKAHRDERNRMLAWMDDLLQLQSTLVVTPAEQLTYEPRLQQDIEQITGSFATPPALQESFTITMPLKRSMDALKLTQQYTDTLLFRSPIENMIGKAGLPPYESVPITTTSDPDLARLIEETKSIPPGLPGVVVEDNYQRDYPHSGEVQSLSHLLGYIGPTDVCDLIRHNPPRFWPQYLIDRINTPDKRKELLQTCGISEEALAKYIDEQGGPLNYLLSDRIGRAGLEMSYEDVLRGQLGAQQIQVDVRERLVSQPDQMRATKTGNNLVLTIDYDLQKKTEEILRKWINEADRRRRETPWPDKQAFKRDYFPLQAGVAIAMEVKTGRVLSMVSWPSFDNNIFNRPISQDQAKALFDPGYPNVAPALNQAIQQQFPPGSTWKQITASSALQSGAITPDTKIRDPGVLRIINSYYQNDPRKDQVFPNSVRRDNEWIDVRQALNVSSNVFFLSVTGGTEFVRNLKPEEKFTGPDESGNHLADMAHAFGFGKPTGVPLPYETGGTMPTSPTKQWKAEQLGEPWTLGDTYNMAIGQGNVKVTPLQLAVASAAVANGGTLYQPQVVKAITDPNGKVVQEIAPVVNGQVPVSPQNLQVVREGMRMSIAQGIDVCARDDISGLSIAGKTGTAEYVEQLDPKGPATEANLRKRSHAWFAGFAPYDNPEIEVLVLVEGAGDMQDGSATIAVPAVTEIMQAYYKTTPPLDPINKPIPPYKLPCH